VPVRASGYIREFPIERKDEAMSASGQRRRIEAYIADRGWQLAGLVEDSGPQLKPWESPGLERLLEDLNDLDKLVVVKLDRVGHQARHLLALLRRLTGQGVELVSLDEGVAAGDETGRAVEKTLAGLVDYELDIALRRFAGWDLERLKKQEFSPATLIDVGAATGTGPLYEAFPDAYLVLVDPLVEFEEDLRQIVEERSGEHLLTALGGRDGTVRLDVDRNLLATSVASETTPESFSDRRAVPSTTLDRLVETRGWQAPFGIRLDAESFEPEIIAGATATLQQTEFVIAEISVSEPAGGGFVSAEFIALMRTHGFEVRDVIDAGLTLMGIHADVIFRPSEPLAPR
jgi:FkbM family methyltransferase